MVRYLTTVNFTLQGIQNIRNSPSRANAFLTQVSHAGGALLFQYWSLGEVDGCFVFEVPNEQIATQLLVRLEQEGNVRTKTIRVFDAKEFAEIVQSL